MIAFVPWLETIFTEWVGECDWSVAQLKAPDPFVSKYGDEWRFEVRDGAFHHGPGEAWVFEVSPVTAYAFAKGEYSHTRFRF